LYEFKKKKTESIGQLIDQFGDTCCYLDEVEWRTIFVNDMVIGGCVVVSDRLWYLGLVKGKEDQYIFCPWFDQCVVDRRDRFV